MTCREASQRPFSHLLAAGLGLAGESDDRPVLAIALVQVGADGAEALNCALDAVSDHHRPRLAAELVLGDDVLVEVVALPQASVRCVVAVSDALRSKPATVPTNQVRDSSGPRVTAIHVGTVDSSTPVGLGIPLDSWKARRVLITM